MVVAVDKIFGPTSGTTYPEMAARFLHLMTPELLTETVGTTMADELVSRHGDDR